MLPALLAAGASMAARRAHDGADADARRTQAALDKALGGYVPDRATGGCFHASFYRGGQSTTAYGRTLLYRVSSKLIFRTDTSGGCERVGDDEYLVTSVPSADICRGDIARTVNRATGQSMGGCSLGDFVAYRRP